MAKVAVELMSMGSDAGYVPSSGWTEAILVPANAVADCAGEEEALWELEGTNINVDDMEDVKVETSRSGVCNYTYHKGTFEVPDGMAVVQRERKDICTRDSVSRYAWVVDEASLAALYQERAEKYQELLRQFLDKEAGFAELREAAG